MKTLNEKASKKTSNTVIAAIIIVSVIVGFLFFQWISNTMQRTVAQEKNRYFYNQDHLSMLRSAGKRIDSKNHR